MKIINVQLICFTGSKFPVLPYTCSLLEESARESIPDFDGRYYFHPYIFNTLRGGVEYEFQKVKKIDVAGFSCYPWNWNRSVKLARMIKKRYPECLLIAGGPLIPEVYKEAEVFLENSAYPFDIYVFGEGERQWIEILKILYDNQERALIIEKLKMVSNIYFYDDKGVLHYNCTKTEKKFFLKSRSAYIDSLNMSIAIKECDQLNLPRIAVWETNRGCPYSCSFCNWGSATRQKVRSRSEEVIFSEAQWILDNIDIVNLGDANFGISPRDYEISKYFA